MTEELDDVNASYHQSLIGILQWMVDLGYVDICTEVSMMSSMLAYTRKGHLKELFRIFSYLKLHHNSEVAFNSSEPDIDMSELPRKNWESTPYGSDMKEILPENIPESRCKGFIMRTMFDSDYAGNMVTHKSRIGFIIYLNSAPSYWLSKKAAGIETSSFGAELIAMKQCS